MSIDPSGTPATDGRADGPPPEWLLAMEGQRAFGELLALHASWPLLAVAPRGDGHPVLVIPGFLASDSATAVLRGYLHCLGYSVTGWALGTNIGPTETIVTGMERLVDELASTHQRAVSLVGYSLGGVFARELARRDPQAVRLVVTLGAPFRLSSGRQSHVSRLYERFSHLHVDSVRFPAFTNTADPLPVPATSIYSRSDGVVAWQSCVEPTGPTTENIEVVGSHCGLGHHPAAVYAVADRLAQRRGGWTPFTTPLMLRHLCGADSGGRRAAGCSA